MWKHLLEYTFDELPPDLAPDGGSRWMVVMEQLLKDPKNDWWDDKTTPGVTEGSGEILKRALVESNARRLANAREEASLYTEYDYTLVNDDLDHCVESIECVIRAARCRTGRMGPVAEKILKTFKDKPRSS